MRWRYFICNFFSIIRHYWILFSIFKNSFFIEYILLQYVFYIKLRNLHYLQFLTISLFDFRIDWNITFFFTNYFLFYQPNQSYINYLILNSSNSISLPIFFPPPVTLHIITFKKSHFQLNFFYNLLKTIKI